MSIRARAFLAWPLVCVAACSGSNPGTVGPGDDSGVPGSTADLRSPAPRDLAGRDLVGAPGGGADLAGVDLAGADLTVGSRYDLAGACGSCPTGYSCGTSSGIPVCRNNMTQIPLFSRVFLILMENTSYSRLEGASSTVVPNLKMLESTWATGSDYHGGHRADGSAVHPSLPNYLVWSSGNDYMVQCDCSPNAADGTCSSGLFSNCSLLSSSCGCPQTASNIGDQLQTAGMSWKAYGEEMGSACNTSAVAGYVPRHMPFVYYTSIQSNSTVCNAHVVDYGNFTTDLGMFATQFTYIAPNLTHDMHDPVFPAGDTNLTNGDTWLGTTGLPPILALDDFKPGGKGLLIIVWDEDDGSGIPTTDAAIPIYVVSPLAKKKFVSTVTADHKNLLATLEDGLGLPRLSAVMSSAPLVDYFPAF
jgi:hypothetical protein